MTVIIPGRPQRPIVVEGEVAPTVTVQPGRDLPPGGTAGQALIKSSDSDFATTWGTATSSAAWGAITGTLASQTDLQSALDAKQVALVSGANIKTVNGSNILGAGDLVVSSSIADGDKGDITVSGSGATWTIDAAAVSLSKMADLATSTILGRATAGTGVPEALSAAQVRTLLGLATVATSGSAADLGTGTLPAARLPAFGSGDVSFAASGGAGTIAAGAVTLAKQANMATASVVYRKTAGAGAPEVQTLATLKTDLGLTGTNSGDQTITLTGMVTGSGTGSFATSLGSFTKAQLDAAVSDGNVLYVGDVTTNATHTGDATGATALTLATVNANVGSFGSATQVATFTVDGKGRTTAAGNTTIAIASTAITDFNSATRAQVEAELIAGTNVTITPGSSGATRTLTIAASGGGGGSGFPQILSWMI